MSFQVSNCPPDPSDVHVYDSTRFPGMGGTDDGVHPPPLGGGEGVGGGGGGGVGDFVTVNDDVAAVAARLNQSLTYRWITYRPGARLVVSITFCVPLLPFVDSMNVGGYVVVPPPATSTITEPFGVYSVSPLYGARPWRLDSRKLWDVTS